MTTKSDYSNEEWQLLLEAPALAGMAVMVAGKSGLGTMKEAVAVTSGLVGGGDHPDVELIAALVKARVEDGERSSAEQISGNPYRGAGREEFAKAAAGKCAEAMAVLTSKGGVGEADAYRSWVASIAGNVAKAAKEGGFLGFGGEQVSAEEQATIAAIETALTTTA